MLESTGQYGESSLRLVDIATGTVVEQLSVHADHFAEGCTFSQRQ
jgi:glutamine cyclotransferase